MIKIKEGKYYDYALKLDYSYEWTREDAREEAFAVTDGLDSIDQIEDIIDEYRDDYTAHDPISSELEDSNLVFLVLDEDEIVLEITQYNTLDSFKNDLEDEIDRQNLDISKKEKNEILKVYENLLEPSHYHDILVKQTWDEMKDDWCETVYNHAVDIMEEAAENSKEEEENE